MNKPVVVVCGAGGFIGGHLVRQLLQEGSSYVRGVDYKPFEHWYQRFDACDNRVLNLQELRACECAVDGASYVYNMAADMGGMGFISQNRARCMLSVLINTHLCMAAHRVHVKRFFFASSACVYNTDRQSASHAVGLAEDDAYPAMPEDGYGWEKLFSERMCKHFQEDFGLETRVARFHNVYGPFGAFAGGREKAPAAICRKMVEAKLSGDHQISIWGDGTQTRSFLFIRDCIAGIRLLMDSNVRQPLNIGSEEAISIDGLVSLVEEIAGIRVQRHYDLTAPIGVMGRNSNNSRVRQYLSWEPTVALRTGVEQTYGWIYDSIVGSRDSKFGLAGQSEIGQSIGDRELQNKSGHLVNPTLGLQRNLLWRNLGG